MGESATGNTKTDPVELYSNRLEEIRAFQASDRKQERRLGYAKVAVAFVTIVAAIVLLNYTRVLWILAFPAVVFVCLAIMHDKRLRAIRSRARSIEFFERGLARIHDLWMGKGESGNRFLDPAHPYARDLDLFGPASLFELLCTARTRAGEETLAGWLLHPSPLDEVRARHGAIRELAGRAILREELFCLGETVRASVRPDALASWGESKPILSSPSVKVATSVLCLLCIVAIVCWAAFGFGTIALAISALNLAWSHRLHARWDEAADRIEEATRDLDVLSGVLKLIDHEHFAAAKLAAIQERLRHADIVPSDAIRRLDRIVGYLESRRNPAMRLLDVLTFWSAQCVFRAEKWQEEFGPHIRSWLAAVGEFEALNSLGEYAFEHPGDVFPDLVENGPVFDAAGLAHPLLPARSAIANDIKLGEGLQLMVLSGPNMAGKSTFIRSVGVNAVLAQCGAPVRARSLKISPLAVAASICVLDSLSGGTSRFYAEIRRLKVAEDLAAGDVPVLFLMDELLSGTNSHDRLEGTRLIVRSLMDRGAIGIVSTHDLALAEIPNTMSGRAVNCHFEDRLEDGKLIFDYTLRPGVVKTSNALDLMKSIGLGAISEGS